MLEVKKGKRVMLDVRKEMENKVKVGIEQDK